MARNVNKLILVGTVARDPDYQHDGEGEPRAHFSIGTERDDEPGRRDWHRCTCTGRMARFVRDNLKADERVYLEGAVRYGCYEREGVTIPTAEVQVREIVVLRPKLATYVP